MLRTCSDVNWCAMAWEPSRRVESINRTLSAISLFLYFACFVVFFRRRALQHSDRGAVGVAHHRKPSDVRHVLWFLDNRRPKLSRRRDRGGDVVDLNRAQPVGL